jgi:hypothetical protein
MNVTLHGLLIAAAGAVIVAPYLVRYTLWRRANKPTPVYLSGHAPLAISAEPSVDNVLRAALNVPYVTRHPSEWSERDWRAIHAAEPRPDYEGIAGNDPEDGASWIATIRAQGYLVEPVPDDATRAEREAIMETNREFERFDRMCTRGMQWLDVVAADTIARWEREYADWCAEHPSQALEDTREWIAREDSQGAVTREFERIMLANALLVS